MDIAKIERLVSMYIELDENDQEKIFNKTVELHISKGTKKRIISENKRLPEKKQLKGRELDKKIVESVCARAKSTGRIMEVFDTVSLDGKAAMLMLANTLANKSSSITEPEVKVTISYRSKTMKDFIEESLPGVNYENAYRLYQEMLADAQEMNNGQSVF